MSEFELDDFVAAAASAVALVLFSEVCLCSWRGR